MIKQVVYIITTELQRVKDRVWKAGYNYDIKIANISSEIWQISNIWERH
jgi:hypothetical protein